MTAEQIFWHRSKEVKAQTLKAVKSPFLCQRSKLMSLERERRAIGFEKEDERRRKERQAKAAGLTSNGTVHAAMNSSPVKAVTGAVQSAVKVVTGEVKSEEKKAPVAPSLAFLGVSMLGNLVSLLGLLSTQY